MLRNLTTAVTAYLLGKFASLRTAQNGILVHETKFNVILAFGAVASDWKVLPPQRKLFAIEGPDVALRSIG